MKFNVTITGQDNHEIGLDMDTLAAARETGSKHVMAYLDTMHPTAPNVPSVSQQIYAAMHFDDSNLRLRDAMEGTHLQAASVAENQIVGRLATPAFLFDAIENKLRDNDYGIQGVFNRKAAVTDSINNTKFERPIIDMTRPEQGRSRAIAQLSEPVSMLLLTVSDKSYRIPGSAIGIEYSDQVAQAFTMPIVTMSVTRQAEVERQERVEQQLLAFLNGDPDLDVLPLASVSGAVTNATALDSTLAAGELSQDAWLLWIFQNSRRCRIDTVITDFATALKIENRKGRPTVTDINGYDRRVNVDVSIANPTWPSNVEIIVSQDPAWPADTIVGFDSRYGYHIVNSTVLTYQAMEEFAIRRSTKLRYDHGSVSYRLYDDAWQVLVLA